MSTAYAATTPMTATAAQWRAALDKAIAEALDVLTEPVSGETFVESATQAGRLYRVDADRATCSCAASAHRRPCKHLAIVLAQAGRFPVPLPVPQDILLSEVTAPPIIDCPACDGEGVFFDRELERLGLLYPRCQVCKGTGVQGA